MRLWGVRVLIYDEEEAPLRTFTDAVRHEGGAAILIADAHQALSAIVGVSPDVLVVAVDRPGLDPGRLLRLVRTLSPEKGGRTPAVSLSALPALGPDWVGHLDHTPLQGHVVRSAPAAEFVALMEAKAGQWVERRSRQASRAEWPDSVRGDRRCEVREASPPGPDARAAARAWLRAARGRR
jgi:CheY-like chemotaxis protein